MLKKLKIKNSLKISKLVSLLLRRIEIKNWKLKINLRNCLILSGLVISLIITLLIIKNRTKQNVLKLSPAPVSTNYLYQNKSKGFAVYLGNRSDKQNPQIKLAVGDSSIDFTLENTSDGGRPNLRGHDSSEVKFEKKDSQSVVYKNVYPGVDFLYTLIENGVKEEIIINNQQSAINNPQFTFKLNLKNAILQKDLMGNLTSTFVDPTSNSYLFHFEKPFMIDAGGNRSEQVDLKIQQDSSESSTSSERSGFRAIVIPDNNWLKTALFPVIIDPTIIHNQQSDFTSGQLNRVKDVGVGATAPSIQLYEQELPTDINTVGLWHMNESSGANVADSSGNGNNGTATGTTIVDAKLGKGRSFPGTAGNHLRVSSFTTINKTNGQEITIEAWIKPNWSTGYGNIVVNRTDAAYNWMLYQHVTDGSIQLHGSAQNKSTYIPQNNVWTYITATVDSSGNSKLYANGDLKQTVTGYTYNAQSPSELSIGDFGSNQEPWNGTIDEVRISNIARTPEEIKLDAQKRPYGIYTSPSLDLTSSVQSLDSLKWSETIPSGTSPSGGAKADVEFQTRTSANNSTWEEWRPVGVGETAIDSMDNYPLTGCTGGIAIDGGRAFMFTSSGTFTCTSSGNVDVLVVGGGGGGGMDMGGGGGGGGVIYNPSYAVTANTPITVSVGVGGSGAPAAGTFGQPAAHQYTIPAANGQNSVFGTLTAIGGGFGGSSYRAYTPGITGGNGGSGGGSSGYNDTNGTYYGGTGTAGQGYRGGKSIGAYYSGGGGGARGSGADSTARADGGIGYYSTILGPGYYWGGGGGGAGYSIGGGDGGTGGGGGGAAGVTTGGSGLNNGSPGGGGCTVCWTNTPGGNGGTNTGGGGGGGGHYNSNNKGGNGGSGIVIVRTSAFSKDTNLKMEGTASMKTQIGMPQVDNNTVGLWHLDETGVGTGSTAYDSSGNNIHSIATGTTLTEGFYGKARNLSGSSEYLEVPANNVFNFGTDDWTFETWIKPRLLEICDTIYSQNNPYTILRLYCSDATKWEIYNNNIQYIGPSHGMTVNNWYHIAVTRVANTITLYQNGVSIWSFGVSTNPTNLSGAIWRIGSSTWGGEYFTGAIDEFRVSKVGRSAEEIAEAYRAGRDHRIERTLSSINLSSKNKMLFYIASDRTGTYLETYINDGIPQTPQATGGTITYSGGYTIHTFTSNGTFIPNKAMNVEVYAWGGGGAGGTIGGWSYGAAGGAGGAAQGKLSVGIGATYTVVVGGGGGVNSYNAGNLTCVSGGGACASWNNSDNRYGSGGGGYSGIFNSSVAQSNALLIAGGGGGGGSSRAETGNFGGAGGGSVGERGNSPYDGKTAYAGNAGTQSAAGADASSDSVNTTGGQGALQGGRSRVNSYGGAGGGGYWGGSGGGYSESNTMGGGAGGSSYYNPTYVSSPLLSAGYQTTPGDSSNSLRESAGNAGAVASAGTSGILIIRYPTSSHQITIDYSTSISSNPPTSTSDVDFNPTTTTNLYVGDTVIVREKVGATTYIMQGEVISIVGGVVTVSSWSGTAPPSGYTVNANVFKWQREYWDISDIPTGDRDAITKLGIRVLDGTKGFDAYFDDFKSSGNYLTNPLGGETITSTVNRYFQYRAILTTNDTLVSPSLTSVTLDYTTNLTPTAPTSLLTNGQTNPTNLGVGGTSPFFSAVYNDPDVTDIANKYQIQVNTDSTFVGAAIWDSGASGTSMSNCTQGTRCSNITYGGSTLTGGTTYYWRIKYWDDDGAASPWNSGTNTFTVNYTPLAPTLLLVEGQTNPVGIGTTAPRFSAIYNESAYDASDTANKYRIQVDDDPAFGSPIWNSNAAGTSITNCNQGTRCADITYAGTTPLSWNAQYYWQIKFWDDGGFEGAWSTESAYFTMTSINAPTGCLLDDSNHRRGIVIVKWQDNTTLETGYRVERSTDGAAFSLLNTEAANSTSSTDNGILGNSTYQYQIRAESANGNSGWCLTSIINTGVGRVDINGLTISGMTVE